MTLEPRAPCSPDRTRAAVLGLVAAVVTGSTGLVLLGRAAVWVAETWRVAAMPVPQGVVAMTSAAAGLLLLVLAWSLCLGGLSVLPGPRNSLARRALASAPRLGSRAGALLLAATLSAPAAHATAAAPVATVTSNVFPGASTVPPGTGAQPLASEKPAVRAHTWSATPEDPSPEGSSQRGVSDPMNSSTMPLPGWGSAPVPRPASETSPAGATAGARHGEETTASAGAGGNGRSCGDDASDSPTPGVVVLRGDSLWSIAARALGPGATVADIAQEWPRWYSANRLTIGPDPDVILPGHVLVAPSDPGEHP